MKPDEPETSQGGKSLSGQGQFPLSPHENNSDKNREAAANVIRSQIDNLFENNSFDSQLNAGNPYQKTHTENTGKSQLTNDWQKYHTAWQNYYQKYYEGYYSKKHNQNKATDAQSGTAYFSEQNSQSNEIFTTNEAVFDLRQKLLVNIGDSAKKIRKSRHFIPIFSGILVMLIFIFVQYNGLIVSNVMAYVSPGNIDPQNIVIDPSADNVVGPEPRLIIPKINVDVPVTYDIGSDYKSQMAAMTKGLAHFSIPGANSHPGEIGNTVLSGHSSNDLFDSGDYKFIFAQLDKLAAGDTVYANYQSKRYTYTVTSKTIVQPNNVKALVYNDNKPILTLITCTPLGTALNRLLVTTEQVSPDPSVANPAPSSTETDGSQIPGNTPSFWERLFGARY